MKKGKNGHLEERNHFDGKDMILLVVTILIIYCIFTWFFGDYNTPGYNQTTVESSATAENSAE